LRDRAVALSLDGRAAEEVNDADAAFETGSARFLKLGRWPLKPRRRHPGAVVPDGREALPVARVAPEHPVVDDLDDREAIGQGFVHSA
jgi:hypothetical protein